MYEFKRVSKSPSKFERVPEGRGSLYKSYHAFLVYLRASVIVY